MKKTLFLLLSLVSIYAFSQDSTLSQSKYEEFTSRTGTMIKTEIFNGGASDNFKIEVSKSTDVETKLTAKAVVITQDQKGIFALRNYGILYIDWDECEDFLKALKFQNGVISEKPEISVSYVYSTKNGVIASMAYTPTGLVKGWSFTFLRSYKYSRAYVDGSAFIIKTKNLSELINLFEKALQKTY